MPGSPEANTNNAREQRRIKPKIVAERVVNATGSEGSVAKQPAVVATGGMTGGATGMLQVGATAMRQLELQSIKNFSNFKTRRHNELISSNYVEDDTRTKNEVTATSRSLKRKIRDEQYLF